MGIINREFYHKYFICSLTDMYLPVITNIINIYYNLLINKEIQDISLKMKDVLIEKIKSINTINYQEVVKDNVNDYKRMTELIHALNNNYKKMYSDNHNESKQLTPQSLFECIFIGVANKLILYSYLFTPSDNLYENEKRKAKILKKIYEGIKKSLEKCMIFNFIPYDLSDIAKVTTIDGETAFIDKKLLSLYKKEDEKVSSSSSSEDEESDTKSENIIVDLNKQRNKGLINQVEDL